MRIPPMLRTLVATVPWPRIVKAGRHGPERGRQVAHQRLASGTQELQQHGHPPGGRLLMKTFCTAALLVVGIIGTAGCAAGRTTTVTKTVTTGPSSAVAPGEDGPKLKLKLTPPSKQKPHKFPQTIPPVKPATPASAFTACDQNIRARTASTTCKFAQNVFYEYWTYWHGDSEGVVAYSPASHRNYVMSCTEGTTVICKAGDGGEVRFSASAVKRYRDDQAAYYGAHANTGPLCHGQECEPDTDPAPAPAPSSPVPEPVTPAPSPSAPETPGFCTTHACIPNYDNGNGTTVQCGDGTYSHSGGIQGACSHHGGVG
jgi:hypothetical protein